jgi:hypothetical protein
MTLRWIWGPTFYRYSTSRSILPSYLAQLDHSLLLLLLHLLCTRLLFFDIPGAVTGRYEDIPEGIGFFDQTFMCMIFGIRFFLKKTCDLW